jgi:nitrogen fixation/metabolism regulation signal transduction histidine kinase
MKENSNREQKIVNRSLQYRVIFVVAASGLFVSISTLICLGILSMQIDDLLAIGHVSPDLALVVKEAISHMSGYFLLLVFLSVFLAWSTALFLSNRIAGPVYNIVRVLDRHLAGEKNLQIKIRGKDFFSELVERLNEILKEADKHKK